MLRPIRKLSTIKYNYKNYRNIHWNSYDYSKFNLKNEYSNFIISGTNCILVISLLWGLEQNYQKNKIMIEHQIQLNEILIACIKYQKINLDNPLPYHSP